MGLTLAAVILVLAPLYIPARAQASSDLNLDRRAFLSGMASTLGMPKISCASLLNTGAVNSALTLPAVRSLTFQHLLKLWPLWIKDNPVENSHLPHWASLSLHTDSEFMSLNPETRSERMLSYLLENEARIESGLAALPSRITARTGLPIEATQNLTSHFLATIERASTAHIYTIMTYHRSFYLAAVEELAAVEPDLATNPRFWVNFYFESLNPQTARKLEISLSEDTSLYYQVLGFVLPQTTNGGSAINLTNEIWSAVHSTLLPGRSVTQRELLSKRLKRFTDQVISDFESPSTMTRDKFKEVWEGILTEPVDSEVEAPNGENEAATIDDRVSRIHQNSSIHSIIA